VSVVRIFGDKTLKNLRATKGLIDTGHRCCWQKVIFGHRSSGGKEGLCPGEGIIVPLGAVQMGLPVAYHVGELFCGE
jgi:hypothetical protein